MSSISFPTEQPASPANNGHFYPSSFDTNSSFQMNPLSSHPPRTPRTSIISSTSIAHAYGSSTYETKEGKDQLVGDDGEDDDSEEVVEVVEGKIRREEVWREMFLTSYGRDKALKLIQYSIRLYLLFHTSVAASAVLKRPTRPPWELDLIKRLHSTASGLSFSRKLLLLFNWLGPLTAIMAQQSVPFSAEQSTEARKKTTNSFVQSLLYAPPPVLLELVHALADDVATFSRLGLFGKKIGIRADRFSDWCWFLSTLVGLVENGVERQMIGNLRQGVESRMYSESMAGATAKSTPNASKIDEKELTRLQKQDYWLYISRAKLVMDLIFVSYDLFHLKRAKESVKTITGLSAAILSSAKLYDRHKNLLLKTLSKAIC